MLLCRHRFYGLLQSRVVRGNQYRRLSREATCSNVVRNQVRLYHVWEPLQCKRLVLTVRSALLSAAERIKWPMKVDYFSTPQEDRKAFEGAFKNLLDLQTT